MTDANNNGSVETLNLDPTAFETTMKRPIALPQSICDDYAKRGKLVTERGPFSLQAPPLAPYINAQGYPFTWGHILERRCDNYIDWDFCLESLLERYHQHDLLLHHLQQAAFNALEASLPGLVGYEWEPAATYPYGFRLYPGTVISAFTLRCHFAREDEGRHWLSSVFLPLLLPGLLFQIQEALR